MTDACASIHATLSAQLDSGLPFDLTLEEVRHLNACADCEEWFETHIDNADLGEDEDAAIARVQPLLERFAELEAEAPPDAAAEALASARDAENASFETVVRAFIAKHPLLDPAAHDIPMDRYRYPVFFMVVHTVNMLMRRILRSDEAMAKVYGLRDDGEVFLDGISKVPAASVQREIAQWLGIERIVPEAEKTPDLQEAFRREKAWRDDETCVKLARWIVAAIRCKPDLMRNFRMVGVSPKDPRMILLEPIRTKSGERDPLELWK